MLQALFSLIHLIEKVIFVWITVKFTSIDPLVESIAEYVTSKYAVLSPTSMIKFTEDATCTLPF